ncbi:hypothetical protein ACI78R_01340 [Geodermatophilus sp. SYSU D01106]
MVAGSLTLVLGAVAPAFATDDPAPEEPGALEPEQTFEWPPADTGGEWLPVPDEIYAGGLAVEACGSTVTLSVGDVNETEYQAMHQPDGTIRVEIRGALTTDVVRESDGAMLDEVDNSGPGTEIFDSDGRSITFSYDGPSFVGAFDEVEAAVFAEQGLPPLFFYASGNTTERVIFSEDPEAETIESAEFLTDTARGVQDVCDLLDDAIA